MPEAHAAVEAFEAPGFVFPLPSPTSSLSTTLSRPETPPFLSLPKLLFFTSKINQKKK
jgi:hypothetical protein